MLRPFMESLEVRALFAIPGTFDASFSGDGRTTLDFNGRGEAAKDVLVQADGKVVVAGYSSGPGGPNGPDMDLWLARYTAGGALDNTFSGDGKQYVHTAYQGRINAIAQQADGKIVAVGHMTQDVDEPRAFAMRLTAGGELDKTFAGDGVQWFEQSTKLLDFDAVAIQSDGKIVAVGNSYSTMAAVRMNANGTLDNAFDGDGRRFVSIGTENTWGLAVGIQGDGKVVVAGTCDDGGYNDIYVTRLKANGATDFTFNGGLGTFRKDYGSSDYAGSLALHGGKIYLGGGLGQNGTVWRLHGTGQLDNTFSGDGMRVASTGTIHDIVVQNTGKVVWVDHEFALGRLHPNGSPDLAFTQHTFGLGNTDKWGYALAKSGDEKVVAAGIVDFGQAEYDAGIARYHAASLPDAPTIELAKAYDPRTVHVKWQDNSANETWFNVQRSYDPNFNTGVVNYTYGANIQSASVGNLTPGIRYYFRVRSRNSLGDSPWSAVVQAKTPDLASTFRVNVGGGAMTDFLGRSYSADTGAGFTGSSTVAASPVAIDNTTDDSLYYTRRYGKDFGFSQDVPNGSYTVVLSFFDPDKTLAGQRKFDVFAEGSLIINDLDLVASAGVKKAYDRVLTVNVADGKLDLKFLGVVGNATISGIAIIPQVV